jgi:hypothetical protein
MTEPNPCAPPSAPSVASDHATLGELVRGWEKLRLIYNSVLLLPGIGGLMLWIARQNLPIPAAIVGAVGGTSLRGIFRKGASLGKGRLLVFGAGLVVSAGVMLIFGIIAFL